MKTTLKSAKAQLAAIDMTITKRDGEYRVTFKGYTPDRADALAYFTNDIDEAISTAKQMRIALDANNANARLARERLARAAADEISEHAAHETYALRAVVLRQLPALSALMEVAPNEALRDVVEHAQRLKSALDLSAAAQPQRRSVAAVRRGAARAAMTTRDDVR